MHQLEQKESQRYTTFMSFFIEYFPPPNTNDSQNRKITDKIIQYLEQNTDENFSEKTPTIKVTLTERERRFQYNLIQFLHVFIQSNPSMEERINMYEDYIHLNLLSLILLFFSSYSYY
jgi:hypothetical protein